MTAYPPKFPDIPLFVQVEREDPVWVVIVGDNSWLFGNLEDALIDARKLAQDLGTLVRVSL